MRWSQANNHPVVDQSSATTIGRITGIVVDTEPAGIAALVVDGSDAGTLVDWEASGGIGTDAVTVESTDAVRLPRGDREQRAVDGDLDLAGKPVYDETGTRLGELRDVTFDPETGRLESLLLDKDEEPLEANRLIGNGSHSVVVQAHQHRGSSGS